MNKENTFESYRTVLEENLLKTLPSCAEGAQAMGEMLAYALSGGGKRVRPMLCLEFCRLCGAAPDKAMYFACATELVHTYSLVHDDLPCMDNDDYRRGREACHKKFGEANALLTGDALLTHAFYLLAQAAQTGCVSASAAVRATAELADKAGVAGMIGGQYIDLATEGKTVGIAVLTQMDACKTGALIEAACVLGCLAADASEEKINAARCFARAVGLAFQIVDDLLDADDSTSSDAIKEKSTYPTLLGPADARRLVGEYTENAVRALRVFGEEAASLVAFAESLAQRSK